MFLQAVFGGQCGRLLFCIAAHSSHLALMCLLFLQAVFGGHGGCILWQMFFGLDTVNTFLFRQFLRIPITFDLLLKQQYFYSNKFSIYRQPLTKVLLQAGQDVVIFGCRSLSASVWAGQALLGFWLLSFTFISLFISGWGQT